MDRGKGLIIILDTKPLTNLAMLKVKNRLLDGDQLPYIRVYEELNKMIGIKRQSIYTTEAVITQTVYFLRTRGSLNNKAIARTLKSIVNGTIHTDLNKVLNSQIFLKGFDYANATLFHLASELLRLGTPNVIITSDYSLKNIARKNGLIAYTIIDLYFHPDIMREIIK